MNEDELRQIKQENEDAYRLNNALQKACEDFIEVNHDIKQRVIAGAACVFLASFIVSNSKSKEYSHKILDDCIGIMRNLIDSAPPFMYNNVSFN